MRRSRIFPGLILVAAAAVILIVAVARDSERSTDGNRLTLGEESPSNGVISEIHQANELAEEVDELQPTKPESQSSQLEQAEVEDDTASSLCTDAAADLERLRHYAEQEIPTDYSLLFRHLKLTQGEKQELSSLLVELRVASAYTSCKRGTKIDPQERADMIEAIIGPQKLARFLSLDQNMYEYGEIKFVDCVLNNNDSSLTDAQQDRLFEIIVEIEAREGKLPGADAERDSIEYLEYHLAELNERTRLFLEQAASELSAEQVGYLFDEYQRLSYRQADALERQKRARLDTNQEPIPWYYPARSCVPRR